MATVIAMRFAHQDSMYPTIRLPGPATGGRGGGAGVGGVGGAGVGGVGTGGVGGFHGVGFAGVGGTGAGGVGGVGGVGTAGVGGGVGTAGAGVPQLPAPGLPGWHSAPAQVQEPQQSVVAVQRWYALAQPTRSLCCCLKRLGEAWVVAARHRTMKVRMSETVK